MRCKTMHELNMHYQASHITSHLKLLHVTPLVLIFANYALSMSKIDHEPLHTLIRAFEYIWTKEEAKFC